MEMLSIEPAGVTGLRETLVLQFGPLGNNWEQGGSCNILAGIGSAIRKKQEMNPRAIIILAALAVTYLVFGRATEAWSHGLSHELHSDYHHGDHHRFHQQTFHATHHGYHPYSHHYRRGYQQKSFYFGYHHRQGGFYFGPSRHYGCTYTNIRAHKHGGQWTKIVSSNCY